MSLVFVLCGARFLALCALSAHFSKGVGIFMPTARVHSIRTLPLMAVFSCCETAKERWRELETGRAIFKNSILKSFSRCTAYNPSASVELGKLQRRVVRVHVHVYTYDVRCASLMHYV